ncbi:MAG TPA: DNA gyrase subunit A, partial [Casimicrobiaceae bacterium]|nr:DNA gyrase subunit A [Casimicrobiaceae bacterium]
MEQFAKETHPISLEREMRRSYLDYAMSVIVGRALPDVRDGLKPVHRRILFAMHEANNVWNRPYVKCARVVGDVLGKYHPHGDAATYEALVRMVQEFSLRYPLIDGQGNFGSVDGDAPAAYRYTECRLQKITAEMLADIDKETVDFVPNYDGKEREPTVLPTRIPNLLINGSSGIAVGMATNIPPHNLSEIVTACLVLLDNAEITVDELIEHVPAPDFPTAGIIFGTEGVREGYRTGRGRVVIRARTHIEDLERGNRQAIIVDEIPYQVNKATLLTRIGELVRDKKLDGIADLRDESDKSGMRVVIELRRGEVADIILNNLFKLTQLQDSFGMNMVALVDNQPRLLNLKQFLEHFLTHRREVVVRRTRYELTKARERGHVLEGLAVALSNVDEIIALIKAAPTPAEAKTSLMARRWRSALVEDMLKRAAAEAARPEGLAPEFGWQADASPRGYNLSDAQAQAILELRLQRLTGLEQDKVTSEYKEVMDQIVDLLDTLAKPARVTTIVGAELKSIREAFGDKRRSEIVAQGIDLSIEDLIAPEDMVVTLSHGGYMKAQPVAEYRAQRRGGRGKQATGTKEDDFIDHLFIANTHDYILCFSNRGRVYWLKVYNVPQGGRVARGKPIVNLVPLLEHEKITAILPVKEFAQDRFVFMATAQGTVKKTALSEFSRPRPSGIIAVNLDDGDYLIGVALTDSRHDIMLFSDSGKALRFAETEVRVMGRNAGGVRGMRLVKGGHVISLLTAENEDESVLTATENGYGKRT